MTVFLGLPHGSVRPVVRGPFLSTNIAILFPDISSLIANMGIAFPSSLSQPRKIVYVRPFHALRLSSLGCGASGPSIGTVLAPAAEEEMSYIVTL